MTEVSCSLVDLMTCSLKVWRIPDSNRPPSDCEPDALPDELNPHCYCAQNYKKNIAKGYNYFTYFFIFARNYQTII